MNRKRSVFNFLKDPLSFYKKSNNKVEESISSVEPTSLGGIKVKKNTLVTNNSSTLQPKGGKVEKKSLKSNFPKISEKNTLMSKTLNIPSWERLPVNESPKYAMNHIPISSNVRKSRDNKKAESDLIKLFSNFIAESDLIKLFRNFIAKYKINNNVNSYIKFTSNLEKKNIKDIIIELCKLIQENKLKKIKNDIIEEYLDIIGQKSLRFNRNSTRNSIKTNTIDKTLYNLLQKQFEIYSEGAPSRNNLKRNVIEKTLILILDSKYEDLIEWYYIKNRIELLLDTYTDYQLNAIIERLP
jgi:hypothetical protein